VTKRLDVFVRFSVTGRDRAAHESRENVVNSLPTCDSGRREVHNAAACR
jgi:hypothetical protein